MDSPSLSVVVAEHRPRGFLADAVRSVLGQLPDAPGTELVVSLAAPDPEFSRWAAADAPALVVVQGAAPRLGALLAQGVRRARGDVVAFLDDDDRFRRGKLRRLGELFGRDPELAFYHHGIGFIDEDGRPLPAPHDVRDRLRRGRPARSIRLGPAEKLARVGRLAPLRPDFNASSIAVRRSGLVPYLDDLERLPASADSFLFHVAGLLAPGAVRCDDAPWTDYRIHPENVSRPDGREDAQRARSHEASLAQTEGQEYLAEVLRRTGPPALVRLAEANVANHRFFAFLRSPGPSRAGWARSFVRLLPYWDTGVVRSNWPAVLGSFGMLVAPSAAQRIYLRQSGWGFAASGTGGPSP